ncbi:uncharacterized protein TNCV_173711 [Trichonephila clavipes]|nr:uncharacterized protein TNCV_173711 [Trichonephila clavipes]
MGWTKPRCSSFDRVRLTRYIGASKTAGGKGTRCSGGPCVASRDSGWTLDEILRLEVRTNRYSPFRGSSSFIEVPKQIAETKITTCFFFIEKDVRGGISQCCNRYAIANNRYMSNFNPDEEIKYVMYLDANNLYGYAMSKYLPLKDFVWSDNDLTEQDILNLSDESDVGYILEVDLEYPSDLHDKHSVFPLAPENKPPPNCKEPRLLTTLEPKKKYVLHYSNLKLYLKLGRKQLNSAAGTKQLNSAAGTKQLNSTGENNSTRQHERNNSTLHCRRPPAPPLQQNLLFLPTHS